MLFEIASSESDDLLEALGRHLLELRKELAHTDDRAYRAELKGRLERLESLEGRLSKASAELKKIPA